MLFQHKMYNITYYNQGNADICPVPTLAVVGVRFGGKLP